MVDIRLVVVGSTHMDFTVTTDHLPEVGETVIGSVFKMSPGGKGANQAVAASRLGAQVYMVGRVGRDYLGGLLLENLKGNKVNTVYIVEDPSSYTGVALITVDKNGRNMITVAPGTDSALAREDVDRAMPVITSASVLLLQLEVPLEVVVYSVEKAYDAGVKVILNPAPFKPLPENLYGRLYAITPNEVEAGMLADVEVRDVKDCENAALKLIGKGVENVVVTLGARGALIVNSKGSRLIPAYEVKPVDTTGAGDAFNAALAVAVAEDLSLDEAVGFANLVAACKVTKLGAQEGLPSMVEVSEFMAGISHV